MVMGQIGKVDLFNDNLFKTEKATMSQANEWYDKILKKEKYNLEGQSCKAEFFKAGAKKESNLENEEGLENFKKLVINPSVSALWMTTNALLILGDIVDTGSKLLRISGKLDNEKMWIKRLKCGWNVFYQTLVKFNAGKVVPLNLLNKNSTNSNFKVMINDETEFITGESALDVDIKEEEKIFKKIRAANNEHKFYKLDKLNFGADEKQNWNTITYTPKLITVQFYTKFSIQFLDFNSAILSCVNAKEDEYKKCAGHVAAKVEYKDAMAYLEKVFLAIYKFTKDELTKKTWRVMRTTIPPFNSESGDAQFYFQEFVVGKNKVNLYNAMKENNVEIFIASTINNAQVISFPYNNTWAYNDPKKCDDKAAAVMGCYETKTGDFINDPKATKLCNPKTVYDLPVRDLTNAAALSTMLHVFIIGNSGKDLVPVKGGKLTGGILVWNRSIQQSDGAKSFNYGFMRVIFSKMYVEVKYYEVRSSDQQLQEVAKFIVSSSALPKADQTQKFLTNKCK